MRDPLSWVPVKFKLPLTFVVICLVAFGVGGFVVTATAQEELGRQIRTRLDDRAAATGMVVRHHLDLLGRRSEDFASDGFIRTSVEAIARGDGEAAGKLRTHLVANKLPLVEAFVDAAILDAHGTSVIGVHGGAEGTPVERTSFTPLLEVGGARDYPSFAVATPLWDLAGKNRIGTLVLQVEADRWIAGMDELGQLPESDGAVVDVRSPGGATLRLSGAAHPGDPISYESTIPESGWELVVAVDGAAISVPTAGLRDRFLAIAAVLLGLTACVLFFPVRFLLAPLGSIREAALRITEGDFSVRVRYSSKDEIGDLSRAFDIMAEAVEERTRALEARQAAIRLERDRLDAVLRSMRDGLFSLDAAGAVTFANAAAQPLVDALRDDADVLRHDCAPASDNGCLQCLRDGTLPRHTCTLDVNGRVYEVHVTTLPGKSREDVGRLCVSRDITERVAQARVQSHQERMNVLGNISAVMAHELNNPLAAIAMFSQMLEGQLDEGSSAHESAEVIRRNAETCKRTIRGLLDTASHAPPEQVEFDLDELIDDVRRFLRPIWEREGIEFRVEDGGASAEPMEAVGDALQLRQVIINLVMNAVQAFGEVEDEGGAGGNGEAAGEPWVTVRTARDARGFRIEVQDNGPGISNDLRRRIFEPFFTTKPPSMGTGLGLSTSRRIVTAHGGSLELASTGPEGTTFRILLPANPALVREAARG
ncbi:MAG: ATP-binding protein [Planctomycetota bacterium]|jgi:signal transduction histidine kinase